MEGPVEPSAVAGWATHLKDYVHQNDCIFPPKQNH